MEERIKQKIEAYAPSPGAVRLVQNSNVLLLVGISGAGKDTVKIQLLKHGGYHHLVSHTTRTPRLNHGIEEQDGVDYHFISLETAERMIDDKAFIEAKMYSGNVYGTSVAEIKIAHDTKHIALTDVEVQGVREFKALSPRVTAVFLLPPDFSTWSTRLKKRYEGGRIDQSDIRKRMHTAQQELLHALETDYFHFVVNDELADTVKSVHAFALGASAVSKSGNDIKLAEKLLKEITTQLSTLD